MPIKSDDHSSVSPIITPSRAKSQRVALSPKKILILTVLASFVSGVLGAAVFTRTLSLSPQSIINQNRQVTLQENSATIDLVKNVGPSVVSITTSSTSQSIFGLNQQQSGAGTGMIVTSDGLILTNKHVVEGATGFTVTLSDGKQYPAKLVTTDPSNDVAFLRIEANDLKAVDLADSDQVVVGQRVVAIGNALGEFANTVTEGVISGKSRPIEASDGQGSTEQLSNLFQTDAAINPGNSGGPLVNIEGQVIGMNTAVAGSAQNIGFAIPINEVKAAIASVKDKGTIERAYLGVQFVMLTDAFATRNNLPIKEGALLRGDSQTLAVLSNSPAAKAGLQEGDIITRVGDADINTKKTLQSALTGYKPGDTVKVTYYRGNDKKTADVKLEAAPQATN